MAKLFVVSRREQKKNPHSRLGKTARVWNAMFRSGNYCGLCRVDIGGKDVAQREMQETNHLKKAHKAEWEAFVLEQQKLNQVVSEALE